MGRCETLKRGFARENSRRPGTVDAVATADGRRIVIKAVRLQGARIPGKASATLHTISAGLRDAASLEHPDALLGGREEPCPSRRERGW